MSPVTFYSCSHDRLHHSHWLYLHLHLKERRLSVWRRDQSSELHPWLSSSSPGQTQATGVLKGTRAKYVHTILLSLLIKLQLALVCNDGCYSVAYVSSLDGVTS